MWSISKWLECSTCSVGRKTGMYFQLFMLEWEQLWKSTKWGNKEPPPACCRIEITPFSSISGGFFVFSSVPWLWLWHKANAQPYDVNKLHCSHAFFVWMAEMAVGEQRKKSCPSSFGCNLPSTSMWKKIARSYKHFSPSDVDTMLTILLCLSCWLCSKISTASGEKLATSSP